LKSRGGRARDHRSLADETAPETALSPPTPSTATASAITEIRSPSRAPLSTEDLDDVDEAGEAVDPHAALAQKYTSANSPTKRPSTSHVWAKIKRLRGHHPEVENGMTHVCVAEIHDEDGNCTGVCNTFMKCFREDSVGGTKGSWKTTQPGKHLAAMHSQTSKAGGAVAKRAKSSDAVAEKQMFRFGVAMNDVAGGSTALTAAAPFSKAFFSCHTLSYSG
jgi:hypothetical protein